MRGEELLLSLEPARRRAARRQILVVGRCGWQAAQDYTHGAERAPGHVTHLRPASTAARELDAVGSALRAATHTRARRRASQFLAGSMRLGVTVHTLEQWCLEGRLSHAQT